jgi:hypothetical protein
MCRFGRVTLRVGTVRCHPERARSIPPLDGDPARAMPDPQLPAAAAATTTQPPQLDPERLTGRQIREGLVDVVAIVASAALAWKYPHALDVVLVLIGGLTGARLRSLAGGDRGGGNSGGAAHALLPFALLAAHAALTSGGIAHVLVG